MTHAEAIAAVESRLGVSFPEPLRTIYNDGDGRYRTDGEWWVVWPLDRVAEENLRAWRDDELPRSLLAFGDDGTGDPFCLPLAGENLGVIRWSRIDSAPVGDEGAVPQFLENWARRE